MDVHSSVHSVALVRLADSLLNEELTLDFGCVVGYNTIQRVRVRRGEIRREDDLMICKVSVSLRLTASITDRPW